MTTTQQAQLNLRAINLPGLSPAEIYRLLEARYGGGFAQWFVDQLARKHA
jgi:hypothetical protein